jgi:GT2 family glycosyltransferase
VGFDAGRRDRARREFLDGAQVTDTVSAVIPTIGRPDSLDRLLRSLAAQSVRPAEVLIADGSDNDETMGVAERWRDSGVRHIRVRPPNAVAQRIAAIAQSESDFLLLLDDDVELDPECLRQMLLGMASESGVVAVVADISNQAWSHPTRAWRWYLRWVLGMREGEWEGRVVGPLLRFCFPGPEKKPRPMEWIGGGITLVRRDAYQRVGGFSDFFLHRCTINEDVDLGIKLGRVGKILFWPEARLAHYHSPSGRVSPSVAAEDDLFNRYFVLHRTLGASRARAVWAVTVYLLIETISNIAGLVLRRRGNAGALLAGRMRGFVRLVGAIGRGRA